MKSDATTAPGVQHGMTIRLGPCAVVTDLIAAQANRTPDRVAISWTGGDPWTYAQLMRHVDAIAHELLDRGGVRGELVGIHVPRRPEMVAAALGVMRAGAAYVPLDPFYPPERLRYMTRHAGVRHVLVWREAETLDVLATGTKLFALDGFSADTAASAALPTLSGDDLAYVLYTSGSTGTPKGVRTLHRNLANDLVSMQREPGVDADDIFGAFTTLAFDASVHEIFLPLLVGARMVLATEAEQSDPAAASALLLKHPMTLLEITPTQLRLMLGSGRIRELRNIKLWAGGEVLPRDLVERVLPECRELWNTYGPTETTVESTIHRVTHGVGPVAIGKPIANTSIYILDESRAPLANGTIGEIWIGGAGVADGYLNDPEKTAERFFRDPFMADGSRMYRTGDLGELRDDVLYFHGRVDDQVKLNGVRIEPGEIEAAALADADVLQAAVVAHDFGDDDVRLILYVVATASAGLAPRLREGLRTRLPAYMQPRHIETLDALPRTPSGKIDRKALPLPRALLELPSTSRPFHLVQHACSTLTPIQPQGNRPPLFVIHGFDGDVRGYGPLARGLGADQPVYGIQAIGLDGITPPLASLSIIAACHLAEIQRAQSRGPYFLAGDSMGALIAYEIARQLHEQDESVDLLAMMCAPDPSSRPGTIAARVLALPGWPRRIIDALRVRRARAGARALPHALRRREIRRAHLKAVQAWQPQTYAGPVMLFQASGHASAEWSPYLHGVVTTVEIPGSHVGMTEHPELLHHLRTALARAQAAVAS